jgi:hypothetical protein
LQFAGQAGSTPIEGPGRLAGPVGQGHRTADGLLARSEDGQTGALPPGAPGCSLSLLLPLPRR